MDGMRNRPLSYLYERAIHLQRSRADAQSIREPADRTRNRSASQQTGRAIDPRASRPDAQSIREPLFPGHAGVSGIIAGVAEERGLVEARGPVEARRQGSAPVPEEPTGQRRRAGRPRLRPASNAAVPPRAEILDAAAELFVSQGLAATTTRQIADRVGIRQASLYYYFAGKDEILLELLTQSVRPSLQVAATLEARCAGDPAAGLYALALIDVQTLTSAPHNIGTLYLMPEVQGDEYASFRAARAELQATYGRLGHAAAEATSAGRLDEALTATLIMQVVESVIELRRSGEWHDDYAHEIAASCLRLVGAGPEEIAGARVTAAGVAGTL
jgi:AcrR family transcriptional regulator